MPDHSRLLRTAPFALARSRLGTLPPKQERLARGLLDEPQAFAFGSIGELGWRFDVDATTILRLAQALGYSGHRALRAAVRAAYLEAAPEGTPERAARSEAVRACHLDSLTQAHRRLGPADLDRAAAALAGAPPVLVAGDGVWAILALVFARLLRHAGVPAGCAPCPAASGGTVVAIAGGQEWTTITIAAAPAEPIVLVVPAAGAGLAFSIVAAVAVMELVTAEVAARLEVR